MSGIDALSGVLRLTPGSATPNVHSSRTLLARSLVRGQAAAAVPGRLAELFRLCGESHRLVSALAIDVAAGEAGARRGVDAVALQADTLREHLRRIWLDWSPALAGRPVAAEDLLALRDCPLLRRGAATRDVLATTRAWLAVHALDMPASDWLAAWEHDPLACLDRWCERAPTLPARLLHASRERARSLADPLPPRALRCDDATLAGLAVALRADPGVALRPLDGAAETGPWNRTHDARPGASCAWLRLGARLAELVRLALPDADARSGARWLRHGALPLGDGEALAWCEMARGALIHHVVLDRGGADGAARVAEYGVIAPTEWNFHPQGPVARALAALPRDAGERALRLLAAAFDPCVAVQIGSGGDA